MPDERYDLFLSYASGDRELVTDIAKRLRAAKVRLWFDIWELVPGENWLEAGEKAILRSKAVGICVGRDRSSRSEIEFGLARDHDVRCIPILLPGSEGKVPDFLKNLRAVTVSQQEDQFIAAVNELIASLGLGAGRLSPPRPVPSPPAAEPAESPDPAAILEAAIGILRGRATTVREVVRLVKALKSQKRFGYARRLLARARADLSLPADLAAPADTKTRLYLGQQHALCTYKDSHLSPDVKFDQAIRILNDVDDLLTTRNQETLGLAGAIFKYKWEAFGQKSDLEVSLSYYLRGYGLGVPSDFGYTAINAAYVLDLLANQEEGDAVAAGAPSKTAEERRQMAETIRREIVTDLPGLANAPETGFLAREWWFLVTVAEAFFGLGAFRDAQEWLARARQVGAAEWEFESTARQLAGIARLQSGATWYTIALEQTEAWQTLRVFLGEEHAAGVRSAFLGRVGLALSGGGFRASLFHIGVLARLAELDVLRHVEALSCVSGGSVIGAHYYLELRSLLERKADREITREDYVEIVRRIERDFLRGVQRNIRTRVVANLWSNLQMTFAPHYSRTQRAGDLFEKELFRLAGDGKSQPPFYLNELTVQPKGEADGFSPQDHNWRRYAKVPVLVLNATALNTGHNWQFTATYMGEPPAAIDSEVDGNYRMRRLYYEEAPPQYRRFRLGMAVAASACVPGIFDPVNLPGLFWDAQGRDIVVRLVDGGVYDNQGVAALLEQGCSVLLASDGSGQMDTQDDPHQGPLGSLSRSNSILQARVRVAEFHDLADRRRSNLLRSLMYIHLKKDLDSDPLNWIGCEDPIEAGDEARPVYRRGELTAYGIRKDIQRRIAAIRTDLDSFNDVEAYALMTSGYRMAEYEFARSVRGFPQASPITPDWRFLSIETPMKRVGGVDREHARMKRLLEVANSVGFKIWSLVPALKWTGYAILAALGVALVVAAFWGPSRVLLTLKSLVIAGLATLAGGVFGKSVVRAVRLRDTALRFVAGVVLCVAGCTAAWVHLLVFDKWYKYLGRANRLLPNARSAKTPAANRAEN
jgi:predicted acylesterase/phospholipase RssA